MSSNIVNQTPYLRSSRDFPEETPILTRELNKAYIDIANTVNNRIIGLFPANLPAITGEKYFLVSNQQQQTLRQVYPITSTASFNHNISNLNPGQITNAFGTYTDGTNTYGLVYGTSTATPGLITFYVTSTQVVFVLGAGAPALTSGRIVLTWLSAP